MNFRDTLSTLMPAPRDDEPPGLRQDIVDELADHLASAYNRELLRGADATTARQRVLEKFGDPAAMARRLWFDAMKGKIMAQRVLIATCLVVTLASFTLVGLLWVQSSRAAAQSTEVNRQLADALVHAQATNKDMLNKLSEMSEAIRNPRSPDWNPLKFIVTDETTGGPPVAKCSITVYQNGGPSVQQSRTTDSAGVADFGLVHPGQFNYQIFRSWNSGSLSGSGTLNIAPGSETVKRVACPAKEIEPVDIRIRWRMPADLEKEGLVICAFFHFTPLEKDQTYWSLLFGEGSPSRSVLGGPGSTTREITNPWGLYLWAASTPPQLRADVLTSDVRTITDAKPLMWERRRYRLSELIVLRPLEPAADRSSRRRFAIVVRCHSPNATLGPYPYLEKPPSDSQLRTRQDIRMDSVRQTGDEGLGLSQNSWSELAKPFPALDRVNEWTITLPDELVKSVREKLKHPEFAPGAIY